MPMTQNGSLKKDDNDCPVMGGTSSADNQTIINSAYDPITRRLLTDSSSSAGSVTSVSVVTANGISGSVATATSTPAITLTLGAITPSAVQVSGLTASEIVITDASKNLTSAAVATYPSLTELTYLKGVTSAVQTQINAKAPSTAPTFATSITGSYLTASEILITDGSKNIVSAAVATYPSLTELTYVKGVTSAIQTQLNAKAPIASPTFTGTPAAPTPTAGDSTTQIATTAFVQQAVRSVPSKEASKYATTTALATVTYYNGVANDGVGATLTGVGLGAITLDGNTPIVGDRLLIKNQASTFQNGIYTVTIVGTAGTVFVLTRALDFNQSIDIKTGASMYVTSGTALAATTWDVNSADSPVMGTDAITFIQSAGPGSIIAGTGISISGITVGIDSTVATLTGSQALTNKTYNGNTFTSGTGILTIGASKTLTASDTTTLATNAITLGGGEVVTFSASNALSLLTTGTTVMTFPAVTDTVVTLAAVQTLTNKRITPRVLSATSYTTDTGTSIAGDSLDMFIVTAQAGALKFNNPTGTPTDGQKLIITVASSTTAARALTWDTAYGATTVALPTTTAATTVTLSIGFIWSASKSLWQCVAVA